MPHAQFFDTVTVSVPGRAAEILAAAHERGVLLRLVDEDTVGVSFDETSADGSLDAALADLFGVTLEPAGSSLPQELVRESEYLTHPVFNTHRSETSMMRYLKYLADKDYALDRGMIPLGSCTMKLNAATEMEAVTWPEFGGIHPFAPEADVEGYLTLIDQLQAWLAEVTGLRRGLAAAERGQPGRARGPARDPRLPPLARRRPAHGVPHPVERARHERRKRGAGRHEGRRRRVRRATATSTSTTCARRSPSTPTPSRPS